MGEMSSIVSRRPSSMNQWKDAFWMSIRLGRSRTCFRCEKLLRARGATTPLLNYEASLGNGLERWKNVQADVDGRNRPAYRRTTSLRKGTPNPLPQCRKYSQGSPADSDAGMLSFRTKTRGICCGRRPSGSLIPPFLSL